MKITLLAKPTAEYQVAHQNALFEGFEKFNWSCVKFHSSVGINTKYVACWGWKAGQVLRARGHEVLVVERGYLGNRFEYSSLGFNGLNGYADFGEIGEVSSFRFDQVAKLAPWNKSGDYILMLGQVPGDQSLKGRNMQPWYETKAKELKRLYGLPVLFRPHPEAIKKGRFVPLCNAKNIVDGSLNEVLSGALFAVTFNSNSAVDAIIAGVPCYVEDEGSMAKEVSSRCLTEIVKPQREQWAYRLAHKQWNLSEISSGRALEHLMSRFQNGF